MAKSLKWWLLWGLITLAVGLYFGILLVTKEQKPDLLIGPSSHGHHQIEMQCGACHTSPFGGTEVLQEACVNCHGDELKAGLDSHPLKKFTDPRNADRVKILDARLCVTCHKEHNPDITRAMGVTLAHDYCLECHQDVGEDRPSHQGLGFETCASAGCHNYHDNRALYEAFLLKHADQPPLTGGAVPSRQLGEYLEALGSTWSPANTLALPAAADREDVHRDWQLSAHGRAQVACTNCHVEEANPGQWLDKPGHTSCNSCHAEETRGFLAGKHGMRLNLGLAPMTPALARLPMQADAAHSELSCNSCHPAHTDDTRHAATEACLGCHADGHSLAFKASPHFALAEQAAAGEIPHAQGVTCATCHMPRTETTTAGVAHVLVEHNQNASLRPNEKMIRPVCLSCHGLAFAIDALADPALIESNFNGSPTSHIRSIDMAIDREQPPNQRRTSP